MAKERLPEIEIYKEVCISCRACDDACPTDVIRMGADNYPFAAIKINVGRWYETG